MTLKRSTKFMLGISVIVFAAVGSMSLFFYQYVKTFYIQETYQKTDLVLGHIDAIMGYVKDELRPEMFRVLPKDEFVLEGMSTSFVNKGVMNRFSSLFPAYVYRRVAINPMNPLNRADALETRFIRTFARHPQGNLDWKGVVTRHDRKYFIHLKGVVMEKEIKPLGDNHSHKVDVRIVAATNRDLARKMADGEFRDDLYYRLNVVSIRMPSLRDIPEDIPLIANHFISLYSAEAGVAPRRFSDRALQWLVAKKWSGNVRQLQNEVQRAVIFSKGDFIEPENFDAGSVGLDCLEVEHATFRDAHFKEAKNRVLKNFEIQYINHLLQELNGNVSLAARTAGLERQSLQYLMRKHDISADRYRGSAK